MRKSKVICNEPYIYQTLKEIGIKYLFTTNTLPKKHIPWESFLSLFGRSNFAASLRTSSCRWCGRRQG